MKALKIDEQAREMATSRFALPPCLHVPIAARDEAAIEAYVGVVESVLGRATRRRALVVQPYEPAPLDEALPIWRIAESAVLHAPRQVWVHVDYTRYRKAYVEAFPEDDLRGSVVDHVINRRVARLKGFSLLRIVAISRAANASSGGLAERWGADYHGKDEERTKALHAGMQIQYADLSDIVKMMNRQTGGALQDPVNEAQSWVRPH
ncbi:MAG TPA: hypothetical protein VJB14_01775 [Planctomycetota bacterium]|nr:hypothetical protein [Planctomycetota bacterium]